MTGPIATSSCLALGGLIGAGLGRLLPARITQTMPLIFGVITIGLGSTLSGKAENLHIVVLALIIGSFIGVLLGVERGLEIVLRKGLNWSKKHDHISDDNFIVQFITLISAFCFGSMGIFGAINEGITGDPSILYIKAVLDLFTGMIFGATLGLRVSLIALPQFIVLATLYLCAKSVMDYISPGMLNDFSGCGGIIFLATGLRMCGIKIFPIINMLPALPLAIIFSLLWSKFF